MVPLDLGITGGGLVTYLMPYFTVNPTAPALFYQAKQPPTSPDTQTLHIQLEFPLAPL